MESNFILPDSVDKSIFLLNKKVEIVREDALKYEAVITSKEKNDIILSIADRYPELVIKYGEKLKYFLSENDKINGLFYCCQSSILNITHNENKRHIEISYPQKIEELGIRKFFRMNVEMDIFYKMIDYFDHYEDVDDVPGKKFIRMDKGCMLDISANGAKIVIEGFCRKDQELVIVIPELNYMKILGTIKWLEPDKFNQRSKISVCFKNIRANQEDKIIFFMFSKTANVSSKTNNVVSKTTK